MALRGRRALVVGGTSGIGRGLAEWLAAQGVAVTVAGQSAARGAEVVAALREHNADGAHAFVPVNAMLLADVRRCARQLLGGSGSSSGGGMDRLDYLVLTQGIASMAGRTLTAEGLEQKLAIHYYGRVLFAVELMPLLEATAGAGGGGGGAADVRVLSVLSGSTHSAYSGYRDDPDMERSFSLKNAAEASGFYTNIALEALARAHPTVTFAHADPGFVATAWGSGFNPVLRAFVRGVQATMAKSPATCARLIGVTLTAPEFKGGFHIVDQNGRPTEPTQGHAEASDAVWAHTQKIFSTVGV